LSWRVRSAGIGSAGEMELGVGLSLKPVSLTFSCS
jgi:hypothetical protein